MLRPCVINRQLRLLQRPSSDSPHHTHNRHFSALINRRIPHPHILSILHSHCRTRLLSLSSPQSSKRRKMEVEIPTITLTPEEEKVRSLLVDVAKSIDSTSPKAEETVLRITGGWVRDKLLNGKSHDIDIGINNMTGFEFASHLSSFLTENVEKYGIPAKSVHKIESNPEKSKHLETATTKILDLDIDFVNLRCESYSDESRIPKMEFGTPIQDALRRDACVNALFYNLMTQEVEDFTTRGLTDLKNHILRTPLPPKQTFQDDPLRVLRLIRFASRLSFTIDPSATAAMQHQSIKTALRQKISRERVGVEIEKMLYGDHPYAAIDLIDRLDLSTAILEIPKLSQEQLDNEVKPAHTRYAIDTLKWLLSDFRNVEGYNAVQTLILTKREEYLTWLFAAITPWIKILITDNKKNRQSAGVVAARDGLKLSNKDTESLEKMAQANNLVKYTVPTYHSLPRSVLGGFVRKMGAEWRLQVFASLLIDLVEIRAEGGELGGVGDLRHIMGYEEFLRKLYVENVGEAWDLKCLLTGNEVAKAMGHKPGRWMKKALEEVMEWQLDNPDGTKEDALANIEEIVIQPQYV
ncbi:CCA tRNA nucleotidyltransferase, mitochondrial [Arthrobotrys musiformis]|uniref:CCA tRNA nucleotidyltransferase, mitochondrial n=1 Tax=Arthrobotrys musiformis TaxID=47236 RepID=A0AAV9VZV7_9PEZI